MAVKMERERERDREGVAGCQWLEGRHLTRDFCPGGKTLAPAPSLVIIIIIIIIQRQLVRRRNMA